MITQFYYRILRLILVTMLLFLYMAVDVIGYFLYKGCECLDLIYTIEYFCVCFVTKCQIPLATISLSKYVYDVSTVFFFNHTFFFHIM